MTSKQFAKAWLVFLIYKTGKSFEDACKEAEETERKYEKRLRRTVSADNRVARDYVE